MFGKKMKIYQFNVLNIFIIIVCILKNEDYVMYDYIFNLYITMAIGCVKLPTNGYGTTKTLKEKSREQS